MAQVIRRVWRSGPAKVRRVSYGYTLQVDGHQVRKFNRAWSREQAELELARVVAGVTAPPAAAAPGGMAFGVMVEKFLDAKRAEGKRSIADDEERSRSRRSSAWRRRSAR